MGFFLDYRPRSINQTQSPGTGPGFSKIPISTCDFSRLKFHINCEYTILLIEWFLICPIEMIPLIDDF